ncbi:MAG: glutamine amidotransferase [Beijerinckiaceae bacterium]|nr:glutamine amidotransferase [Beijerinckiaceae bacterium]
MDWLSGQHRPYAPQPSRRILIILHQEHSSPGRVGRLLVENGYTLDIRRPRFGDPLPKNMDGHDAAIIFGGPMSANDEEDWIRGEIDWIGKPLAAGKPFLGICLGAQMLARHLGHRVAPHPEGIMEAGYYDIRATEHGGRLCRCAFPGKVYQWHREGFDLPAGATLLAQGDDFETQAFSYGSSAYGLQFHPEVTYAMMCKWTVKGEARLGLPGAMPREMHLKGWYLHDAAVAQWLKAFLRAWVRGEAGSAQPCVCPQAGLA